MQRVENHSKPVRAARVAGLDYSTTGEQGAGSFDISADGERGVFRCWCPCGCGNFMALPIRRAGVPHGTNGAEWEWDGNADAPTLAPSIRDLAMCRFHGHIRMGVWTFEGDSGVR